LLAGLLSFEGALGAAAALGPDGSVEPTPYPAEAPVRSVAPMATPVPSASRAELDKLKAALDDFSSRQEGRAKEQSQALSRSAEALAEARETLNALQGGQTRASAAMDDAKQRLQDLGGRLQSLEQAQSKGGAEDAARDARLDEAIKAQAQLRLQAQEDRDQLKEAFKSLKAAQSSMDERALKLASLADMLSVMRSDQERDHEEIVELRQSLKALEPKPAEAGNPAWWSDVLRWPYWGVVGVGLGAVAIGLAASK
jgi:chromosome segregation ATPase